MNVLDTILCDQVCQCLTTGRWFYPDTPNSSTNKTNRTVMPEILFKVALHTINKAWSIMCWTPTRNISIELLFSPQDPQFMMWNYVWRIKTTFLMCMKFNNNYHSLCYWKKDMSVIISGSNKTATDTLEIHPTWYLKKVFKPTVLASIARGQHSICR